MLCLWLSLVAVACADGSSAPLAIPAPTATVTTAPSATPGGTTATVSSRTPAVGLTPQPLLMMDVERAFPALSFSRMTSLTYADDGSDRLFVTLQPGRIMVFPNDQGVKEAAVFLDIRARVSDRGNEEGLLGLAFDPDYATNGYFYVYYSAAGPRRSVLSRFSASADDPMAADSDSERIVLEVPQPFSNHNGGQIVFGPDGYLYIGLGDGGRADDPFGNGQNRSTLLGTILRIDVSGIDADGTYAIPTDNPFVGEGGGAREEIWAYGLRNPWRFSIDPETGDLWAADVGQDRYEEIDIIRPGLNYGWNVMEGAHCFQPSRSCDRDGLEMPVVEYGHDSGCSVTGGYVYRGSRLPSLDGAYVYGDFCSGRIWALRHDGVSMTEHLELVDSRLRISSFGVDQSAELYILAFDEKIYRLVPR